MARVVLAVRGGDGEPLDETMNRLAPSLFGAEETWSFLSVANLEALDGMDGDLIVVEPAFAGKPETWLSELSMGHPGARIILLVGSLTTDSKRLARWAESRGIYDIVTGDLSRGPGDPPYTFLEALRRPRAARDPAPWREAQEDRSESSGVQAIRPENPSAPLKDLLSRPDSFAGEGVVGDERVTAPPIPTEGPVAGTSRPTAWSPPAAAPYPPAPYPARSARRGSLVTVVSPKGGVGKSTVANNVAIRLGESNYRVLVADFDLEGQSSGIFYGPAAGWGLDYLLRGYPLDEEFLARAIARAPRHPVDILRGVSTAEALPALKAMEPQVWFNLMEMLLSRYDYVIVDTPPGWQGNPHLEATFALADRILIVVAPGAFDVGEVRRDAPTLTIKYRAKPEALRLVANKYVGSLEYNARLPELSRELAEAAAPRGTLSSVPVIAKIPENYESFVKSEWKGETAGIASDPWRRIVADITGRDERSREVRPVKTAVRSSTRGSGTGGWEGFKRWFVGGKQ